MPPRHQLVGWSRLHRWSFNRWSLNCWSLNRWGLNRWSLNRWSLNRWSLNRWSLNRWSLNRWCLNRWSLNRWCLNRWCLNRWSLDCWRHRGWRSGPLECWGNPWADPWGFGGRKGRRSWRRRWHGQRGQIFSEAGGFFRFVSVEQAQAHGEQEESDGQVGGGFLQNVSRPRPEHLVGGIDSESRTKTFLLWALHQHQEKQKKRDQHDANQQNDIKGRHKRLIDYRLNGDWQMEVGGQVANICRTANRTNDKWPVTNGQ